jgi:hypothetical protein
MKIRMTPVRLCLLFAALVLLTRSAHVAFAVEVPDATIALMLLGGMWVRRWPGFAGMMGTVFAADWIAVGTLGVPDYCLSPAYAGLVPAYLAVWVCGWWLQARRPHASLLAWVGTTLVASSAAFLISNAFWYAFSGRFNGWSVARFAADVLPHYPAYAGSALGYVALAWIICLTARHLARGRSPQPAG